MVPRCDNCCDMLWLEQRRTNSPGRAGCWYCLTLGTCVETRAHAEFRQMWRQHTPAQGPGGHVTHMGVITRTSLQRVLTTCVKCVVSIELRCLCISIKVPHCHFQQISGFVMEEGYQSVWFPGQGLPSPALAALDSPEWRAWGRDWLVTGAGVDTILSEECKQIHNIPITAPGPDQTRGDNCWDERGLRQH